MDLTGTDPSDYEEEVKREQERLRLVRGLNSQEAAKKAYDAAVTKVRTAVEAEEARRGKVAEKIKELVKAQRSAHEGLEFSSECRGLLLANFVDRELETARDKAYSAMRKKAALHSQAVGHLASLKHVVAQRDPKKIEGVLRDAKGQPRREEQPVGLCSVPPRKFGLITNPNRWNSKEERAEFMKKIDELELTTSEALIAAEAAGKVYNAAEAAYSAAVEAACGE